MGQRSRQMSPLGPQGYQADCPLYTQQYPRSDREVRADDVPSLRTPFFRTEEGREGALGALASMR